jgi:hypothetical protein
MSFTTDDLISSIKSRASVPTSQNLFATADFLRFSNEELQSSLVPMLMSVREEYLVTSVDVSIVPGTSSYRINKRAIGGKLRDVQLVSGTSLRSLAQLNPEDITSTESGQQGFYIKSNSIVLSPTPTNSSDILRVSFFQRPNKLVAVSDAAQITSVDTVNNQVVVSAVPSTFNTGTLIDFIRNQPGFECLDIDKAISGISGTTITFGTLPSDLEVGDYVCIATESPIPQIPQELHPMLAQLAAIKCLEAMSDQAGLANAEKKLKEMKQSALEVISPRVDGEAKKIMSTSNLVNSYKRSGFWR